jgi:hypothetical protein
MWSQPPSLLWLLFAAMLYVLVTCMLKVLSHLYASEIERHELIRHARSRRLEYDQHDAERRLRAGGRRSA